MSLSLAGSGQISGFDAALSGFGGLVAVKSAIFTGTQSASVTSGSSVAVTDLSITHEVADSNNKLIILASVGYAYTSYGNGLVGIGIYDGSSFIGLGDAAGNRVRVSSGGQTHTLVSTSIGEHLNFSFVHTPGAGSKTYELHLINISTSTRTLRVNRSEADTDSADYSRAASSLVIQEVKV